MAITLSTAVIFQAWDPPEVQSYDRKSRDTKDMTGKKERNYCKGMTVGCRLGDKTHKLNAGGSVIVKNKPKARVTEETSISLCLAILS